MSLIHRFLCTILTLWVIAFPTHAESRFLGLTNFSQFSRSQINETIQILSPLIRTERSWDELIVSWNYSDKKSGLKIEVRAVYPTRSTKWFCMGEWSLDDSSFPRQSMRGQADPDGTVDTDTLRLNEKAAAIQIRITFVGGHADPSRLSFLGLCFTERTPEPSLAANPTPRNAISLIVPEHSQADYPEGIQEWCSPTATAMILEFWSNKLGRPDLKHSVPEVARAVNDPNWPGTGNWPFNTSFAGAHEQMRGYVTRLESLGELRQWLAAGIPVACSVSYNRLRGMDKNGNGHLVICVGFDGKGSIILNDPGRKQVRRTYPESDFLRAWQESRNTVYIIHPINIKIPPPTWLHWCAE